MQYFLISKKFCWLKLINNCQYFPFNKLRYEKTSIKNFTIETICQI